MKPIPSFLIAVGLILATTASAQNVFPPSGYVGIGTTSPAFILDVASPSRVYGQVEISGGNAVAWPLLGFNTVYDGNGSGGFKTSFAGYCAAIEAMQDNGRIAFLTNGSVLGAGASHGLSERMSIMANGFVGIGTISPGARLDVNGATMSHTPSGSAAASGQFQAWAGGSAQGQRAVYSFYPTFEGTGDNAPRRAADILSGFNGGTWGAEYMAFHVGGSNDGQPLTSEKVRITASGNVGIGTSNPTQKLSVNGTIRAKELVVDTGWSDYVFDESYRLAPLAEVEQHIKSEKHLPGIPSAAEIAEHGVSMGDMQSKLLAKIEELTLHLIAQEKRAETQANEIAALRRELRALKAETP